jgi:hypothetical protein
MIQTNESLDESAIRAEKVKLITEILKKRITSTTSEERQVNWFNELYDKSLSDLRIYYNVYK